MKFLSILALLLTISGCAGTSKYVVSNSKDDQFADKNGAALVTIESNHIGFKDALGLVPTTELIPYLTKNNEGSILEHGFHLVHVRSNSKWLNIQSEDEIVFLADGSRISAKARNTKIDHSTVRLSNSLTTYYYDYAWYSLTNEEMEKVCNASNLKIKIYGKDGIVEYGTRGDNLNKSFYQNIRKFYNEEVIGSK